MNDKSSLNQDSEECLEDIENISNIAESFRNENYGFSKIESAILLNLESSLFKCLDSGWEIDNILEDGELSPFEFDQLSINVNQIDENITFLSEKHKENIEAVNKIIHFYNKVEDLIKESYYSEALQKHGKITAVKHKMYSIDETSFYEGIKALNNILQKKKASSESDEISKLEREISCLAKIFGTMEEKVVFNILYTKPTLILKTFRTSLEIIEATIMLIYELIKESYYLDKIQAAKEGLAKIAETEDFDIGKTISIKGLFTRKRGISRIEELSDVLKSFS
ncbi:MAG: hypothetical protein KAQ70_00465 [Candidatus Heimdallarchaeota archaeon]|nr:hypothetical protein [Candidatus Heimdallarchaeota archaeon]